MIQLITELMDAIIRYRQIAYLNLISEQDTFIHVIAKLLNK